MNVVIVGASGHAKVVIDIVERHAHFTIVGILDRGPRDARSVLAHPVLGSDEELPALIQAHGIEGALVAIGDNFQRASITRRLREIAPALLFPHAIHPSANVATDVQIGEGTVIMAGVSVNPSTTIGRFCILNTSSSVDHDSSVEDFASIGPGATMSGGCFIGAYTAIGTGAVVSNGIRIGSHSVIGAGAVVVRPVEDSVVAYGVPARVIRTREPGDSYLS